MKLFFITLIFCSYTVQSLAQSDNNPPKSPLWAFDMLNDAWEKNQDFFILEKKILKDSTYVIPNFRDYYGQALMTVQTFNGNIKEKDYSNLIFRKPINRIHKNEITNKEVFIYDAANYILSQLSDERILMFNESHLYPQHRAFVSSLLDSLYQLGYKHLFLEALSKENIIGTHPERNLGIYINEPTFANLLRKGINLGFKIHAYDGYGYANRDSASAQNILNVLHKYPNEKAIILCGSGHNNKKIQKSLAYYLSKVINPFTIDLTIYSEPESSQYYKDLIKHYNILSPSVLVDECNKKIIMQNETGRDLYIITPPTQFNNGYPHWLLDSKDNKLYVNNFLDYDIAEVYILDEVSNARFPIPYSIKYKEKEGNINDKLLIPLKDCRVRFYTLKNDIKCLVQEYDIYN